MWSRKHSMGIPVWEVYQDVMNILYYVNDQGTEVFKSAREKILGKEYLKSAPGEYWDILTALDLGFDLDEWDSMELDKKARIIAARHIKNMIEIIERYYDEMDERKKQLGKKDG